jgi:hypothetical protein
MFALPAAVLDAELGFSAVLMGALVIGAFVWIARTALRIRSLIETEMAELDLKVRKVERHGADLRNRVENLYDEVNERVDYAYFNERLDELTTFFAQRRKAAARDAQAAQSPRAESRADARHEARPEPRSPPEPIVAPPARDPGDYVLRRRR